MCGHNLRNGSYERENQDAVEELPGFRKICRTCRNQICGQASSDVVEEPVGFQKNDHNRRSQSCGRATQRVAEELVGFRRSGCIADSRKPWFSSQVN